MGQGPNVVYALLKKANIPKVSHIYMDNLFTSFPLLNKLSEMEIGGIGTMRQNRLNNVPIMNKKDLEKKLFLAFFLIFPTEFFQTYQSVF